MRKTKLGVNPQKTEYMIIGHPRRTIIISSYESPILNGSGTAHVKQIKLLGLVIDEGLNWSEQFRIVKGTFKKRHF